MKTNTIIKALIQKDKNVFRLLHDYFGYDFEKDFEVFNLTEKFTFNSLEKIVSQAGYIPRLSTITILVEKSTQTQNKGKLYAVMLNKAGNNVELLEKFYSYEYRTTIEGYYYRKRNFENDRKHNTNAYIICQKDSDMTNKLLRAYGYRPNLTDNRFDIVKEMSTSLTNVIYKVVIKVLDNSGYKFEYIPQTRNEQDINIIIDKSGYLREIKSLELERKAEQLRRDRAKAEYKEIDNSARIKDLAERIQEAKTVLVSLFKDAKTYDEYKSISEKIGGWIGFRGIIYDYERLITKEQEKEYNSTQSFNYSYNSIIEKIDNLMKEA